ncbi:MAG: ABC transporter substrate-binding protein, partial [Actinomycetota bacterium]
MERSDAHALTQPGAALGRRQFLGAVAATGLAAGAGGLLAGCGSHPKAAAPVAARHHLLRGGNLKLGLIGGSLSDTLDPHNGLTYLDRARLQALYSPLVQLDAQARTEYVLAESITPKGQSPAEWIIRLRPGITFHDGQKLTSADVIFTFRRIISNRLSGSTSLGPVDLTGLKALDDLTVLVPMTRPYASFPEQLAGAWYHLYIAPATLDPARPNGTGPFVYQSFSAGRSSVFTRNPHYFKTGLPHAATLTIMDFPDTISLQNAL